MCIRDSYKTFAVFATLAVFPLSVSEIADPCCAVFLGHKSVPDTALAVLMVREEIPRSLTAFSSSALGIRFPSRCV